MEEAIKRALDHSQADFTEIRSEKEYRTNIRYKKGDLENIENSEELGGFVRCLVNGAWGIATFNDVSSLEDKVSEAYRVGRSLSRHIKEPVELADTEPTQDEVQTEMNKDFRRIDLDRKREVTKSYNELMLNYDGKITSTTTAYGDSLRELIYANTEGTYIRQEIPDTYLLMVAVAKEGPRNVQRAHESIGEAGGFDLVEGLDEKAEDVASRAVKLLSAAQVEGGDYTVILNPDLAGVFIHEAFGHLCEADHIHKNEELKEIMKLGRDFGTSNLNVVDNGYLPGRRGNTPYDDEGVKRKKTYLIKEGVLNSFLHSRETAAKMGQEPTGNGRAISYRYEPIVRMTNTYIENGDCSFDSMLSQVDRGIYALDAFGGQTQLEQFTFSAGYAYEVRNGDVGRMLRDVVLTGNVFETLNNIEEIGDDLDIIGSAGGCGKEGQQPLPVTDGSPHLMIKNVTIGGR